MKHFKIEPASSVYPGLIRKITLAGMNPKYQWFFSDGAFTPDSIVQTTTNSWISEDFVVLDDEGIIAFFSAKWVRPLDILNSLRIILFEESKSLIATKAFFEYLDYLFAGRGCNALNWIVAEKNEHAYRLYEKFTKNYMGHKIGKRHFGQKSYSGIVSDIYLYEITKDEYFEWKKENKRKK